MQKVYLSDLLRSNSPTFISSSSTSSIHYLRNANQIMKIFNPMYLNMCINCGNNLEKKILISDKINISPEVIRPIGAIYNDHNQFIGYTSIYSNEKNLNQWDDNFTIEQRQDLYNYADLHYKIEQVVKNSEDIVIPDLCSCDNILVKADNSVKLIDYDGFQVKDINTFSISSSLGDYNQYLNSKKYSDGRLFTKELDKKSLIVLYFLNALNIDLNRVGIISPNTKKPITLDEIFKLIGLDDNDFNHKVWKLFQEKESNEYLGEDIFRIADKYDMVAMPHPFEKNLYFKKLVKKR